MLWSETQIKTLRPLQFGSKFLAFVMSTVYTVHGLQLLPLYNFPQTFQMQETVSHQRFPLQRIPQPFHRYPLHQLQWEYNNI